MVWGMDNLGVNSWQVDINQVNSELENGGTKETGTNQMGEELDTVKGIFHARRT